MDSTKTLKLLILLLVLLLLLLLLLLLVVVVVLLLLLSTLAQPQPQRKKINVLVAKEMKSYSFLAGFSYGCLSVLLLGNRNLVSGCIFLSNLGRKSSSPARLRSILRPNL